MKKFSAVIFSIMMTLTVLSVQVFADDLNNGNIIDIPSVKIGETVSIPVGDAEYIRDLNGDIIKISDLPSFSSTDEFNDFLEEFLNPIIVLNPYVISTSRATHGTWDVATQTTAFGKVVLWVAYTTSGNSNTGTITYHEAYTQFTGNALGISWEESYCHSEITSSQKAVYASASGVVSCSILVSGLLEVVRLPVNLEGYAYCVR